MVHPGRQLALVADDHELYRTGLARLLHDELGFEAVIGAASFEDALICLTSEEPLALATFDLAMVGMDGAASLQLVRRLRPTLPIAVVTGSGTREAVLAVLAAGVQGYAPKTLGAAELVRGLETVLQGHLFVPPSLWGATAPAAARSVPVDTPPVALTPRQRQVVRLIAEGKSNKEIARALRLAEGTIKVHVNALYRSLSVRNRAGAVAALAQQGWRRAFEALPLNMFLLASLVSDLI